MKCGVFVACALILDSWHFRAQAQSAPSASSTSAAAPAPVKTVPSEPPSDTAAVSNEPATGSATPGIRRASETPPATLSSVRDGAILPPRGPSALSQYRQKEFSTRFRFWTGQELLRGGVPVDIGYFGGNGDSLFAESPTALEDIHRFRTMRITGTTLYVVGLGLLITDLVLTASRSPLVFEENTETEAAHPKPLFWALFLPGTAAGLTGGILMQNANAHLSDAVEDYNADLARTLERQSKARPARGLFLRYQGRF